MYHVRVHGRKRLEVFFSLSWREPSPETMVKVGVFHDRKGSLTFATTSYPSNCTYLKKRPVHPSSSSLIPSNAQHRKIVWNFAKSDTQGCRSNPSTWREIDTLALAFCLPAYIHCSPSPWFSSCSTHVEGKKKKR